MDYVLCQGGHLVYIVSPFLNEESRLSMTMNTATAFAQTATAIFTELFRPQAHFVGLLKNAGIQRPDNSLFARGHNTIPFYTMRYVIEEALDRNASNRPSALFTQSKPCREMITLRDMTGCTNSKSSCGDFSEMKVKKPKDGIEASKLETDIFEGSYDCIAKDGESADVIRQAWDGQKWFTNYGASHRAAALWHYDIENAIDRYIDCKVETVDVAPELKMFALQQSIWCFKVDDIGVMNDAWAMINEHRNLGRHDFLKDIGISFFNHSGDHYAIIVPKHSKLDQALRDVMDGVGFNLSDWILHPDEFTFDKESVLLPRVKTPTSSAVRSSLWVRQAP